MGLFDELFNARSLYFDVFDKMIEAVYICDTDRNLIYFNRAAEKLDGYLLKDVKGKSTYELYGLTETESPMLRALTTERPVVNEEFSYYVNGKEVVQLCNSGPIYEEGRLIGAYTVQRDLTMYKDIMEKNIALQRAISRQKNTVVSLRDDSFSEIIGGSDKFCHCVAQARRAARTSSSVMLIGATGSGKEVFARAVHEGSDRRGKPFLALNCAAIPESLIESILFGTTRGVYTGAVEKEGILSQADGGTVFLDEINSMPLASQGKLLRVLE
ncbi:MAG: sigma 54-interacting transcriptional regulator, partial [Clostridia bacterium]